MSKNILDILLEYANVNEKPLMIIASRNQIDANSGYVMSTKELNQQVSLKRSKYIKVCRDHCGPYFLDSEGSLSLNQAVEATKKTIAADIENNFDLIHIDTSRCSNSYKVAEELIKFSLDLNPNIEFEFGTEENIGVAAGIEKYKQDVEFARQFPNMKFVVAQTGSLVMENRQVGLFNLEVAKELSNFANSRRTQLKEHNADYLDKDQISLRKIAGVHALNIAPQLGVIETETILNKASVLNIDSTEFRNLILANTKWKKWIIKENNNMKILVAGHYHFKSKEYKSLQDKINDKIDLQTCLKKSIFDALDLYYKNFA